MESSDVEFSDVESSWTQKSMLPYLEPYDFLWPYECQFKCYLKIVEPFKHDTNSSQNPLHPLPTRSTLSKQEPLNPTKHYPGSGEKAIRSTLSTHPPTSLSPGTVWRWWRSPWASPTRASCVDYVVMWGSNITRWRMPGLTGLTTRSIGEWHIIRHTRHMNCTWWMSMFILFTFLRNLFHL